jgi:hypothetical protein
LGNRVAVAVRVGSTRGVALRVGVDTASGSLFCRRLDDETVVEDGIAFVGGTGVTVDVQDINKRQNKTIRVSFIA